MDVHPPVWSAGAMDTDYLALNRANWDDRAALHAASPDYRVEELVADPTLISGVVQFDAPRLGDLSGLDVVHLQCHIGTDTLSLHRLGVASVTGVDLSPESIQQAARLAERAGAELRYVVSDVYSAPQALAGQQFDLVYTGIGALCWLPSIDRWAQTVAALLRPGGRLLVRDVHPLLWAIESDLPGFALEYTYYEQEAGNYWDGEQTYVSTDRPLTATRQVEWNHSLGEIVTALLAHGMRLTALVEHESIPWDALPGRMVVDEHGEWRLADRPERLPASFTIEAVRD